MTRWARQSGVLLLALSAGCAPTLPRVNMPKSWIPGANKTVQKETEKTSEKSPDSEQELLASQSESSGKSESLLAESAASGQFKVDPSTKKPEASSSEAQSKPRAIRHDPATRMLIEAELKDATPDERKEWLAFLDTIESANIPHVLQSRRIVEGKEVSSFLAAKSAADGSSEESTGAGASPKVAMDGPAVLAKAFNVQPVNHEERSELSAPAEKPSPESNSPPVATVPTNRVEENTVAEVKPTTVEPSSTVGTGWPKRIKSLTDHGLRWGMPFDGDAETPPPAGKTERSTFGLPLILGNQQKQDASSANTPSESVPTEPVQTASAQMPQPVMVPTPRLTPGSQLWEDEVQKLISLLEAETSSQTVGDASRDDVRKQVALRMLYVIEGEPTKSQQVIPGLPQQEQEFWTELFLGLSEHLEHNGTSDPGERATQAMAHLRSAAHRLQQNAKLRMRNVTFCQQIQGFGNYEGYPADQFLPGQTVLVYAEIRNFQSDATPEGFYRTRIKSTIEIYSDGAEKQVIDRSTFEPTEDLCRTLRSDYYHSYRINLPPHLPRGAHLLKLVIHDELSGKMTTESISFTIR
ncbi:hypothetical protein [Planctomicrobium sp. SH527]|uniref:hypothetical protein n=1 Tax=Planctomicrobium sp. SH527 TaxID=3448123 RepID=UPI003F5C8337